MHFQRFLHRNNFTLKIGHKPLEWLAIVLDAYGWKGRWINMLQDFNFKILHRLGSKHSNVDALNQNPMGSAKFDEEFKEEIQDIRLIREMGVQTWIGRRNIRNTTLPNCSS